MQSLKDQSLSALMWDFLGKFGKHTLGLTIAVVLARLLEPEDFGIMAIIVVVISFSNAFVDMGLTSSLIQRKKLLPIHYTSVFYFNFIIGIFLTILLFSSAEYIANFYGNDNLILLIQVSSFSFLIQASSGVQQAIARKGLDFKSLSKAGMVSVIIGGCVSIFMAVNGSGIWSLLTYYMLQNLIFSVIVWSNSNWAPGIGFSQKALRGLWKFGFRMFLAGMIDNIFRSVDTLVIGKIFSLTTLGLFNRAKTLSDMLTSYTSGSLMSVMFPVFSKIQRDLDRFQVMVLKTFRILSFVVALLTGLLYLTSYELIVILFGEKWVQSVIYFKIFVLSSFVYPLSALLVNVLRSRGKSKEFLRLEIYKKVIAIVPLLILYFHSIELFLYGLILSSLYGGWLNILFISRELNLLTYQFIKPIATQIFIAIFSVISVELIVLGFEWSLFGLFVVKVSLYLALFSMINSLLNNESYYCFMHELRPLLKKIKMKL